MNNELTKEVITMENRAVKIPPEDIQALFKKLDIIPEDIIEMISVGVISFHTFAKMIQYKTGEKTEDSERFE